jgi:uncharacterized protein (TIGR03083 family)
MSMLMSTDQAVRRPALDRDVAMRLAATEYDRFLHVLRTMPADAWTRPSGCPGWDVRALASHLLGMAEMAATLREQIRQMRKAKKAGGVFIDALTGLQVAERADMTPLQIIDRFAKVAPKAARSRRRTPGFVRARTMPDAQPVGGKPDSPYERWTFGYLIDVILTRDPWLHRTELCTASGLIMELTPTHDGILVADVANEWAGRHGQPCSLRLTGPAGGSWQWGQAGAAIELDAVEFCRILAGRAQGEGLLATEVPF